MSFFTKPSSVLNKGGGPAQASFIDILYDHEKYLMANDGLIARPLAKTDKKVAIVGSGPAGLIAAYQLLQVGVNVEILEADSTRYGGRVFSYKPIASETAIFEFGAMRVPPSEKIFNYYADQFGMEGGDFPDPGKVNTDIIFNGTRYVWEAEQQPPTIFKTVSESWEVFANSLNPLINLLKDGSQESFDIALRDWQALINPSMQESSVAFSKISFYDGLVYLFVQNYRDFGLKKPWGEEEFALFGALGLGSGGFGPLYQVNFSEIVRLIVNGLETDQKFYSCGLDRLVKGLATTETKFGRVLDRISYGCKVTGVKSRPSITGNKVDIIINGDDCREYDAVIVATTNRAMQVDMGLTLPDDSRPSALPEDIDTGIRQLHLMNSSKLFVLTRTKFWKTDPSKKFPANIQTDGLARGFYCLDYPGTDHGVVLVSYTWGDDSTKYIAIKDPAERLELLARSLREFVPNFVDTLIAEVMPEHTRLIDWQDQQNYYGAFKLNYPGQDAYNQQLYYQFTKADNSIYLAGDSISWSGGWIEGALQTGMNAAVAVVNEFQSSHLFSNSPMTQSSQAEQFNYG